MRRKSNKFYLNLIGMKANHLVDFYESTLIICSSISILEGFQRYSTSLLLKRLIIKRLYTSSYKDEHQDECIINHRESPDNLMLTFAQGNLLMPLFSI